jgi:TatD DNase family protein
MNYIDIHSHTNFAAYNDDRDEVITRAKNEGVAMITVGTQFDTSEQGVAMANQYDHCYAIIGLHPIHTTKFYHDEQELGEGNREFTSRGEIFDVEKYRELVKNKHQDCWRRRMWFRLLS